MLRAPAAYLASYTLSLLGNSIATIALPLIVLQTTGSVLSAGAVAAATALPAVLAGLFMGVVIDRIDRRTSSIVTDLISAGAIAALPVVDLVWGLELGWFVLLGIVASFGDVPGMTAREALLPAVVRASGIPAERLIGLREMLGAITIALGPAAAGTLITLLDGSAVLWVTAGTSLAAAVLTLLVPRGVGAVAAGRRSDRTVQSIGRELRDGWRALLRSPFLVATTALSAVSVIVLAALQGLVLPAHFTAIDEPGLLGFVLTSLAIGMLVGGALYAVLGPRGPRRAWFLAGLLGAGAGFAVLSTLAAVSVVFVGAFVVGVASGLFGSLIGVLTMERIPEALRGRVLSTQNALLTAVPSFGILGAAVVVETAGIGTAAIAAVGVWGVAIVIGLVTPSLRTLERDASAPAGAVGEEAVTTDAER